MSRWTVLYRNDHREPLSDPKAFICESRDSDGAEQACLDRIGEDALIVWVAQASSRQAAMDEWLSQADAM